MEISQYLSKDTKKGDFTPQRTHSGSFFIIRLASIHAVVLPFTANKQTNTLNYIITYVIVGVIDIVS